MKLPKLTPTLTLFIAFISFFVIFSYYFFGFAQIAQKSPSTSTQTRYYTERVLPKKPSNKIGALSKEIVLQGIIREGKEVNKQFCSNGLYLVSSDNKSSPILLRAGSYLNTSSLYNDSLYQGKEVLLTGRKPLEIDLCDALSCGCEEFIVVSNVIEK